MITSLFYLLAKPFIFNLIKGIVVLLILFFVMSFIEDIYSKKITNKKLHNNLFLLLIIVIGIYFRTCLARFFLGDFDLYFWENAANWAARGRNIYQVTNLYNYFPPWIVILKILRLISWRFHIEPFYFLIKLFLSFIDLLSLIILVKLAKAKNISANKVAILFFLNPVSIIITGFHGQFENIAILAILIGLYCYYRKYNNVLSWLAFTGGGIIKHMFINQVLFLLTRIYSNKKLMVLIGFLFSGLVALLTLLPYWKEGSESIIKNLFLYSYTKTSYGVPWLFNNLKLSVLIELYKYLFIMMFFLLPFLLKIKNLTRSCLIATLFFITFTPGIGDQYFIMPIALGSLLPSFWFYIYSFFASCYLFGSSAQLKIEFFKIFSNNFIFITSFFWLISEIWKNNENKS